MVYERRIITIAVAALVPLAVIALLLAWSGDFAPKVRWTVVFFVAVAAFVVTYVLHTQLVYPIRTLASLLAALREEDYSLRARSATRDDALGEVMVELNALAAVMESRKLDAVEAAALLRAVLSQIDAAIFAFDQDGRLQLVNAAGQRLLGMTGERMIGLTAAHLGIEDVLEGDSQTLDRAFPGGTGRWDVRRSLFRERGVPHRMLVVADITRALREEELDAWRRIVRVLGHELNNSLAPIKSITTSLERLVARDPLPVEWREDIVAGMRVIGSRADALTRFTRAYAQLARLPEPRKQSVDVEAMVRRIAALETRVPVESSGDAVKIDADPDQLEQLLLNLLRNAADASVETGGGVRIEWGDREGRFCLRVVDEGRGVTGTSNLFVPFFTTKPGGSGVGLFLSRQIAEANGGTLTLENRDDGRGAVATLVLGRP